VFAAALLNSQPMGFYAPAQIVRDAREHAVEARHPDVNFSDWDSTLEGLSAPSVSALLADPPPPLHGGGSERVDAPPRAGELSAKLTEGALARGLNGVHLPTCALRLGLRQIDGFREDWALQIIEARREGLFVSIDDLRTRAALPAKALDMLAAADALGSLELTRREGLWAAKGLPRARPAPLFAFAGLEEDDGASPAALPRPALSEEVVHDYETVRLSLKAHPVSFLRARLKARGAIAAREIEAAPDGRRIRVGGVVLVRQRPGSSKGVVFVTLEDETGIANVVVWPKVFDTFRPAVMGARMMLIEGRLQRAPDSEGGVVHLVAERIEDCSGELSLLSDAGPAMKPPMADDAARSGGDPRARPQHRHPRDVRILPRSRDFH
jgi:error-prone DNA polymerase